MKALQTWKLLACLLEDRHRLCECREAGRDHHLDGWVLVCARRGRVGCEVQVVRWRVRIVVMGHCGHLWAESEIVVCRRGVRCVVVSGIVRVL